MARKAGAAAALLTGLALAPVGASPGQDEVRFYEHNGSVVGLTRQGRSATITYRSPRPGLAAVGVRSGTVLFQGSADGSVLSGTAFAFKAGCSPAPYAVTGSDEGASLVLRGPGPVRSASGCTILSLSPSSPHSTLLFKAAPDPGMRG